MRVGERKGLPLSVPAMVLLLEGVGCNRTGHTSSGVIFFQETSINIGEVPAGARFRLSLKYRNPLPERVYGFGVATSCGCLSTTFRPGFLEPDESKTLSVVLQVPHSDKRITEFLTFECSHPSLDGERIGIQGRASEQFRVLDELQFGIFPSEEGAVDNLVIEFLQPKWTEQILEDCFTSVKFHTGDFSLVMNLDHEAIDYIRDLEGDLIVTLPVRIRPSCFRGTLANAFMEMDYPSSAELFLHLKVDGSGIPLMRVQDGGSLFIDPTSSLDLVKPRIMIAPEDAALASLIEFTMTSGTAGHWCWEVTESDPGHWNILITPSPDLDDLRTALPQELSIPYSCNGIAKNLPVKLLESR